MSVVSSQVYNVVDGEADHDNDSDRLRDTELPPFEDHDGYHT